LVDSPLKRPRTCPEDQKMLMDHLPEDFANSQTEETQES
jgi:hypothetical protein